MFRTIVAVSILAAVVPAMAAPPAKDDIEKASEKRDTVICKRFVETGSLVRSHRDCKTKAEWQRDRDNVANTNVANSCRALAEGGNC